MAPALAVVATYALLLAWNEYLYQYLLLSSTAQHDRGGGDQSVLRQRRGAVELHDGGCHCVLIPPIAVYYGLRRYMVAGLTMGGVKG